MTAETTGSRMVARRVRRPAPPAAPLLRGALAAVRRGGWAELGLVGAGLASILLVRVALGGWVTNDYTNFLSQWFAHLRLHGFAGLGDEFANYNMPYLYLLWLGSLVTPDALLVVKTIGAVADLALALGCVAVLLRLGLPRELAAVGGAAVLLLPEVLLNSAAWGQADAVYAALLVWAVRAALADRPRATWVLVALACTVKLQAAFVLPAFVVLHVTRRWGWRGPVLGLAAAALTYLPALAAGRSAGSLASIYLDQAGTRSRLSRNAPSLYALLPESRHDLLHHAGMFFALACVCVVTYLVLRAARRRPLEGSTFVLLVAALGLLAPYTLPMMHERYFYVGDVLLLVYALRHRALLPWALVAQAVAVLAYTPYLFREEPVVPMPGLALVEAVVLLVVVRHLLRVTGAFAPPAPAPLPELEEVR